MNLGDPGTSKIHRIQTPVILNLYLVPSRSLRSTNVLWFSNEFVCTATAVTWPFYKFTKPLTPLIHKKEMRKWNWFFYFYAIGAAAFQAVPIDKLWFKRLLHMKWPKWIGSTNLKILGVKIWKTAWRIANMEIVADLILSRWFWVDFSTPLKYFLLFLIHIHNKICYDPNYIFKLHTLMECGAS